MWGPTKPTSRRLIQPLRRVDQERERHWTEKALDEMTERDWRIFREDYLITIRGGVGKIPNPIRSWKEAKLSKRIMKAIQACGYESPTAIQMAAIPIGLEFRDIIGISETGSGKTAAFLIPLLTYISHLPPINTPELEQRGPYAVIMEPSRELAIQVHEELAKFSKYTGTRCAAVVGGNDINDQAIFLGKGVEVVVATPGRIKDCLDRRMLVLNQCNYIVLDEADRMIESNFEEAIHYVLDSMPPDSLKSNDPEIAAQQEEEQKNICNTGHTKYRTTIMFSATMPAAVERLAKKYLRREVQIEVGVVGRPVERIAQRVVWTPSESAKHSALVDILRDAKPPIIVFVNQKRTVDYVSSIIESETSFSTTSLHGGKQQAAREKALDSFKGRKSDILVATDVAGRGIDVKGVTLVINYDLPTKIEDYTHRIGRTGRAGEKGEAVRYF